MDKVFKVGIIGAGSIAQYHCEAIEKVDCMKLTAVSSRNSERASRMAEQFNAEAVYTDYNELLRNPDIDAVVIATPTFTHSEIIKKALKSGKHVFCEKPPAMTAAQTAECTKLAEESGRVLMFGFVCRFSGRVQILKKLIEKGRLGDIYYAEAVRIKDVTNINGWFVNKDKARGGELFDACIHEIDQVLYLMGYPKPKYVSAVWSHENSDLSERVKNVEFDWVSAEKSKEENTIETLVSALISFENGSAFSIKSGRNMFIDKNERGYTLLGNKAGIKFDGDEIRLTEINDDGNLETAAITAPDLGDGFVNEFAHFADCCIKGTVCACPNDEAVQLMKILDAIYESAEKGEPVFIN